MKTTTAVLAAIVVIGGLWYVSSKDKTTSENITSSQTETQATTGETITISNPSDLATKGGQYKCTFNMVDPNTELSGVVYVDGKKYRGDFVTTVKAVDQTVTTHSLSDGGFAYTWNNNTNTGFKFSVAGLGEKGMPVSTGIDFSMGVNAQWKCGVTKLDIATFAVPRGINFSQLPVGK